jgi:hypothetical protein
MATKTWKLGEVCKGGIITIETTKTQVKVIAKEWDNSKEWNRLEVNLSEKDSRSKVDWFLFDLTTSYWGDEILKWIETKVKFKTNGLWD